MKIIKILFVIFASVFFVAPSYAQKTINPQWTLNSTGESWDVVSGQAIDGEGNIYLTGNFTETFGCNTTRKTLSGEQCVFIAKFNTDSELLWLRKIVSTGFVTAGAIAATSADNVFICGNYSGEMSDKNLNLVIKSSRSGYVIKLKSNGDITWAKNIDGTLLPTQMHLAPDHTGGVYLAATFKGKLSMGADRFNSNYYNDVLITHFSENGNVVVSNTLHGADDENVFDLDTTPTGELLLTGSFAKELIIDRNILVSNGLRDVFIIKLTKKLQAAEVKQFGGIYDDEGKALAVSASGKLFLAGNFTGEIYFGETCTLESEGTQDVFVLCLDNEMECDWATSFGSPGSDCVAGMALNKKDDVYLIGTFKGKITIDEQLAETPSFANDAFLAKFTAAGKFKFLDNLGGEEHDFGRNIAIDAENEITISGNFSGAMQIMGSSTASSRAEDLFVAKLHDCEASPGVLLPPDTVVCATDYTIAVNDDFVSYFWNGKAGNNRFIADNSGQIILEAIDKFGCHSSDTMLLVLNQPPEDWFPDTIRVQQGETLTLEAPLGMQEYLWSDGSVLPFLSINTSKLGSDSYAYWVEVNDIEGCSGYDEVVVTILSINTDIAGLLEAEILTDGLSVLVYPNPLKQSEDLTIHFPKGCPDKCIIQIYSSIGGLLYEDINNDNSESTLKISKVKLLPGSYVLVVKTHTSYFVFNLIIQ
ncbi:MAG: T9SS type A sorting domain-containing protein [Clostridia bacterium]|nr:T9SS type A sorting domain-containing protein [Clostridia bacterium]